MHADHIAVWPGIRRSFPTGPNAYLTIRPQQKLELWVELPDAGEQTQVRVLTDLPAALPVMLERGDSKPLLDHTGELRRSLHPATGAVTRWRVVGA